MMSDAVVIAFISMMGSLLTVAMTLWTQMLVRRQDAKIQATQETIVTLEKNTNSIKDALVDVTARAAYARGIKQGETNNKPDDLLAAANAAAAVATAAAVAAAKVATDAAAAAAALRATLAPALDAAQAVANTADTPINVKLVD